MEEYKEGRSLLERCDKLLHSIAEITASELQPSPVSVLDSSFYKDESSPSPVMKRSIDFKGASLFHFLFFSLPLRLICAQFDIDGLAFWICI